MRKTRKVKWFLLLLTALFVVPALVHAETTVSLTPTDDAYVDDANPSLNYGNSSSLYVGDAYINDPIKITRSYLKFDISGIPAGATIVSAKLHIGSVGAGPNPPLGVGSHYLPDDLWTEGSITFNNAPTNWYNVSTDNALVENKDHNMQCCDCWDVLKAVNEARDGLDDPSNDVEGVLSIVLKAMSWFEGDQHSWCQLASKEDTTGYGYEPELIITYDESGGGSVSPGTDCYITEHAMIMFGTPENPPIPPGFFGPGSDPFMGVIEGFMLVLGVCYGIAFRITMVLLLIAVADYAYQKWQHNKNLRMSKQEIKDEYKQAEGDPQIKQKMKQFQRGLIKKQMLNDVPDATVIVTNPTHISIAIKYEQGMLAPMVVAKGADNFAFKIREIAKEHEIPLMENVPLARALYKDVEVGAEVPEEYYKAVAEILSIVMRV